MLFPFFSGHSVGYIRQLVDCVKCNLLKFCNFMIVRDVVNCIIIVYSLQALVLLRPLLTCIAPRLFRALHAHVGLPAIFC